MISALVAKANSATPAAVPQSQTSHLHIDVDIASPQSSPPALLPMPAVLAQQPVFAAPTVVDTAALEAKKAKAAEKRAAKKAKQEEEARLLKAKQEEEARLAQIKKEEELAKQNQQFPTNEIEISRSPSSASSTPVASASVPVKVTRLGKEYLEQDNFLFDINTKINVGYWNAETGEIEECGDDSDDDEE